MIKKTLSLMILFNLAACAHQHGNIFKPVSDVFHVIFYKDSDIKIPTTNQDPTLAAYIPQFVSDAKDRGVIIPQSTIDMLKVFQFVDQMHTEAEPGVMAACTRYYTYKMSKGEEKKVKWMNIEVLRNETESFTEGKEILLRELLYHELFHCFMDKGHLPVGTPGIMSPTLDKNNTAVMTHWKELVDEMFSSEYLKLIPDAS